MITIVTSLIKKTQQENTKEMIPHFVSLAMLGLPICIYVSTEYDEELMPIFDFFPNVKKMKIVSLLETNVYKLYNESTIPPEFPEHRNIEKDTWECIVYSHTKHEFMEDTISTNPWNSTHFAWMDIQIMNLIKNKSGIYLYLKGLSQSTLLTPYLTFPGCWNKLEQNKINDVLNAVHWRFCGGFCIGDKESMVNFCKLHREQIPLFLKEHNKWIWDFNFWAWLETFHADKWSPVWYRGDHNDSIFMMSSDFYTAPLKNQSTIVYPYPDIHNYYPTSAAYLYTGGKHILNTRYVNYWIYPNGCYLFHSGQHLIENKNMLSELNAETFIPEYYKEIQETLDIPITEGISRGIEDIRLYEVNNKIKYVATTIGYSSSGKPRIIIGNYDIDNASIIDGSIINPQHDTWSEKNWIPIIKRKDRHTNMLEDEEWFIYKWSPMEIGKIDYEKKELVIIKTHPTFSPLFSKMRGSTIFQEVEEGLLGVVHFSEEHGPRHYYHMLLLLDKETFAPIKYTETFCFEKLGVEFCIGFAVNKDIYTFWISRHDRDPVTIQISKKEIKWI